MSAVAAGVRPRVTSAKQLLSRSDAEMVRQLASAVSMDVMKKTVAEAATKDGAIVVLGSSSEDDTPFNHDEEVDNYFFEVNKAAHRKYT